MSTTTRPDRTAADAEIIRLNSLGYSLGYIGAKVDKHPTTITLRLASLGIQPADTRHAFMEGVLSNLAKDQQDWLATQLGPHTSIRDYVKSLLVKEYVAQNP